MLIMTRRKAEEFGLNPLATLVATASICTEPHLLAVNPGHAIKKVLDKAGMTIDDVDLIEINEAFAAVPLVSSKILADGDDTKLEKIREKLNVNGGAIAIGHPIGASGVIYFNEMVHHMKNYNKKYGVQLMCGGFGVGISTVVEAL